MISIIKTILSILSLKFIHKSTEQIVILECYIHGTRYYECQRLVTENKLQKNDQLILKLEPDNEYDEFAIKIYNSNNEKLGYIPKKHSQVIANIMQKNKTIYAIIKRVDKKAWDPLFIKVIMDNN